MRGSQGDALETSWTIQEKAAQRGFDWSDISGVFAKVREEIGEIERALASGDSDSAKQELGDLLFATVNLARFLDADPEAELHRANARFTNRFDLLDEELYRVGRIMETCTLEELDEVWERVKERLRGARASES